MKQILKGLASRAISRLAPKAWKEHYELDYWKTRKREEGVLDNSHYKHFYTEQFGLDDGFYADKVVVDIGCGPRGSLEWASMASRRIGVDPLAKEYLRLGADKHAMEYISAPSEHIPLKDGECDVVCSFNSLDHVSDVEQTVAEIKRITKSGGKFLLLVEVNHPPTDCEPHQLDPKLVDLMKPEFECQSLDVYGKKSNGMYKSILANEKIPNPAETTEDGYLSAVFQRV